MHFHLLVLLYHSSTLSLGTKQSIRHPTKIVTPPPFPFWRHTGNSAVPEWGSRNNGSASLWAIIFISFEGSEASKETSPWMWGGGGAGGGFLCRRWSSVSYNRDRIISAFVSKVTTLPMQQCYLHTVHCDCCQIVQLIFDWDGQCCFFFIISCSTSPVSSYDAKYIVFEQCLLSLFETCPVCIRVCKVLPRRRGSFLAVDQLCPHCQFFRQWKSQPVIGSTPVGNLQRSAAIYFCGVSFSKMKKVPWSLSPAECVCLTFTSQLIYF